MSRRVVATSTTDSADVPEQRARSGWRWERPRAGDRWPSRCRPRRTRAATSRARRWPSPSSSGSAPSALPSGSTRSQATSASTATTAIATIVTATACGAPQPRSRFTAGMSVIASSAAATIGTSTGRATISVPTNANRKSPPRNTTSSVPWCGVGPAVAAGGGTGSSTGGAAARAGAAVSALAGPDSLVFEAARALTASAPDAHGGRPRAPPRSNRCRCARPRGRLPRARLLPGHGRRRDRASRRARAGAWGPEARVACGGLVVAVSRPAVRRVRMRNSPFPMGTSPSRRATPMPRAGACWRRVKSRVESSGCAARTPVRRWRGGSTHIGSGGKPLHRRR